MKGRYGSKSRGGKVQKGATSEKILNEEEKEKE
jgi:hypothetical protein